LRKDKEVPQVMDTFLTLVIALGGIATGIGAIWAAMLARRQLDEQRRFLAEQTEIARRQAQVSERQAQATEQSLAQTERSLAEQIQSLREQNERSRLNLELDLLTRLGERFDSPQLRRSRSAAGKYLLDNAFVGDEVVGVEHLNRAAWDVVNFFEDLGYLQRIEALQPESVWNSFSVYAQTYWLLCNSGLKKLREEWEHPAMYEHFEYLCHRMADLDRERGAKSTTQAQVRRTVEEEAALGEKPPTNKE
jgi:hypothetical protein